MMKFTSFFSLQCLLFSILQHYFVTTAKGDNLENFIREISPIKKNSAVSNNNYSINARTNTPAGPSSTKHDATKWKIGRVSKKNYEVVNFLWRKTKVFINVEDTTLKMDDYTFKLKRRNNTSSKTYTTSKHNFPSRSYFTTTIAQTKRGLSQRINHPQPSSTPSSIEFYYMDDSYSDPHEHSFKFTSRANLATTTLNRKVKSHDISDIDLIHHPLRAAVNFHGPSSKTFTVSSTLNSQNGRKCTPSNTSTVKPQKKTRPRPSIAKASTYDDHHYEFSTKPMIKIGSGAFFEHLKKYGYEYSILGNKSRKNSSRSNDAQQIKWPTNSRDNIRRHHNTSFVLKKRAISNGRNYNIEMTTLYDRIKFFDLYDNYTKSLFKKNEYGSNTPDLYNIINIQFNELPINNTNYTHTETAENESVVFKNNIEQNTIQKDRITMKNKEADKEYIDTTTNQSNDTNQRNSRNSEDSSMESMEKQNNHPFIDFDRRYDQILTFGKLNSSQPASWNDYPFVAAYVNEPSLVFCDAVILSPHWLITAGSCLTRYISKKNIDVQHSAYVTYCGGSWSRPERITYVKYSLVHPRYNPKDNIRRILYNIGAIQVVTSMSSCAGWSSVTLISHQFVASSEGSLVSAVGWGLDRYKRNNFPYNLPKSELIIYKGMAYSNNCSETLNIDMKTNHGRDFVKNVYCLNLPPYFTEDEERKPAHGSLLLVGGKLVALYLQEQRRPWGSQSALYTGVWRLIPWLNQIAREPENDDFLPLDVI